MVHTLTRICRYRSDAHAQASVGAFGSPHGPGLPRDVAQAPGDLPTEALMAQVREQLKLPPAYPRPDDSLIEIRVAGPS